MSISLANENSKLDEGLRTISYSFPVDHKNTCLHLKAWVREENGVRPPLLLVHDLGQSHKDYEQIAQNFANSGFNTYIYDLRGHGQVNILQPVHARVKTHARDLLQIFAWVRHKERRNPPILLGVGVGAIIATEFAAKHPDLSHELVLCAPILQPKSKQSKFNQFLLDLLAEIRPKQALPHAFCPVLLQRPKLEEKKPQPRINAGFAMELLHLIPRTTSRLAQYKKPVLVLCPENDELSDYDQVLRLAASSSYPHLTAYDLADCPHHVFEHQPGLCHNLITTWLKASSRASEYENRLKVSTQTSIMDPQQNSA